MAIEMRTEIPQVTSDQAEAFATNVLPRIKTVSGFIAGAYGLTDTGFFVTEFWESQETHERWLHEVIVPMLQQMGRTDAPVVEYRQVDTVVVR